MALTIDKKQLLGWLGKLNPTKRDRGVDDLMQRVSMTSALPALTEINHEKEYLVVRQIAEHLVGKAHEPDMSDLE